MKKTAAVLTLLLILISLFPVTAFAATHYVSDGETFNIGNCADGDTVVIESGAVAKLTGTAAVNVVCNAGVTLKLTYATINTSNGSASIRFLSGDNVLTIIGTNEVTCSNAYKAAVSIAENATLTINTVTIGNAGSLQVTGGSGSAAIGANNGETCGDIIIEGGEITAIGGSSGAGIGSSNSGAMGSISISGGTITATGGTYGAGIGQGYNADEPSGSIDISGGTIYAYGGSRAAGLGGGTDSGYTEVNISGGTITAKGGQYNAGIGSGKGGSGIALNISGGTVFSEYGDSTSSEYTDDIGRVSGINLTEFNLSGDALVFARNAKIQTPITDTHLYISSQTASYISTNLGVSLPSGWTSAAFYAQGYTVSYDDNGGSGGDASENIPDGATYSVADDSGISRTSYTFSEWNTKSNGTGTSYDPGDTFTVSADITLYAVWSPITSTSLTLSSTTESLDVGETAALTASLLPSDTLDATITWQSSKTSVATVSASGVITAVGSGTATITATNGTSSDTCTVTVSYPMTAITVSPSTLNMEEGTVSVLGCMRTPLFSDAETVYWSSSDTSVATVSSSGQVTGISAGTCTITAFSGGFTDTCAVTINPTSVTGVTLNYSTNSIYIGEWFTLSATVSPSDATYPDVTWLSSDTSVATVSSSGMVEAIAEGTAEITATADGKSAVCTVTVSYNAVTSVKLSNTSLSMYIDDVETLTAEVLPSDAENPDVTWTSSDTSVATVSSAGVVEAVAEGTATITATADGVSDSCTITVSYKSVTSVTLSSTSLSMYLGDTEALSATVLPTDAANPTVTWTSSDTSVATVSSGVVQAVGEGACTITATADGVYDTCSIYVGRVAVTSVELSYSTLSMYVDDQRVLTADVSPSDASDPDVTWKSSDTSVATVNSNGVVTAIKKGTATITATADGVSDTCSVTVSSEPDVEVSDVDFIVENSSVTVMYVGDTLQLTVAVTPSDATDTSVTWSSSDTEILTVTEYGLVTAKSAGDATITVTAQGNASATYKITVKTPGGDTEDDDSDGSSAEPTATPEVVIQSEETDVYLTFDLDVSNLGENAKYIQLPNDEIIDIEGKDVVSVSILASDLNEGTLEIVTLDEDMVPLGSVELAASGGVEDEGFPWFIVLITAILSAGGMFAAVRLWTAVKK